MRRDRLNPPVTERAACGIGFLASRQGVAERRLVEIALDLCGRFDHRGAPGHGAGILLDIPWGLLLDRFPDHMRLIAQRDVALGMFFLPYDAPARRRCVERVEELAALAGADVLDWADVPCEPNALPPGLAARRTAPVVRQALFRRPAGMSEDGWFACRYLLRLALDEVLGEEAGDQFTLCSLSNRTVVYKGLAELSRIAELYPDLAHEAMTSRFVLFHSRYSTNTTTAWRRAQPFWAIAHNGEIATIRGNVAWMHAIGRDLLVRLVQRHPRLAKIGARVKSVICAGGSDSANLDDMVIALNAGGMSLTQALLALLPESPKAIGRDSVLRAFHDAMGVFLGACDGPAAVVACDGDEAVAHLDRNALRPLWLTTSSDYAVAASELTGTLDLGAIESQRLLGPGETVIVRLGSGEVLLNEAVHDLVSRSRFARPGEAVPGAEIPPTPPCSGPAAADELRRLQIAFGMTKEDREILLEPLIATGKAAVGSMGDDTAPAAMLDIFPRRLEDHFKLRFAQETSPPIDPIRDAWVFEAQAALGDRSGLWNEAPGRHYRFDHRVLAAGEIEWLLQQEGVTRVDLLFDAARGPRGLESALDEAVARALLAARSGVVVVLSDRGVTAERAALPLLRVVGRLHDALARGGSRHRVGIVADSGVWDIQHCALTVAAGADAICPWLGCATAGAREATYLKGLRAGFVEAMSMTGVTPSSAYCGAKLFEAVGLDPAFVAAEFPGVACHLGGIPAETVDGEWLQFHAQAFAAEAVPALVDAGEFRQRKSGRPHAFSAEVVRTIHRAAGYSRDAGRRVVPEGGAYDEFARTVSDRSPIHVLDLLRVRPHDPVPLEEVESEAAVLWRFMVPGMSEGALSEPAHRALARAMNVLRRWCLAHFRRAGKEPPPGIGPIFNSGEGGFEKRRVGGPDGNLSIQYAGARFTITPGTAARALEAEIKFAQGAKPGKGGQLPGKKVSRRIAQQRGCEPGYELISPPVNHNLYSIEDVKLMLESWRHLNPEVNCALKYVATAGVELVAMGGVNAGANRLHLSDGSGGTGAAKRVDQKHAGVPAAAVLPAVQDMLLEEDVRELVEVSVDGGVQNGEQALKLVLLGADRIGFGTSVLMTLGCSMLRQCHLAGPHPDDPSGQRRIGCAPGVATQDPALVARFSGAPRHVLNYLRGVAGEMRRHMAAAGIRRLGDVVGRRDLLERKPDLAGKAALIDVTPLVGAPPRRAAKRDPAEQSRRHMPRLSAIEVDAARRALAGEAVVLSARLNNAHRAVGVRAAGEIARARGDAGLDGGRLTFRNEGAAGHFYAAYAVGGMEFRIEGLAADSCFTAAYGGRLTIVPPGGDESLTVVGNTFGYGARRGAAFIAGRGGHRFGICLRKSHEGDGPRVVVQGVGANAFQYVTGGVALVLGPTGFNLGAGMTGGAVYVLDLEFERLNPDYVQALPLDASAAAEVEALLEEHHRATGSELAARLLDPFQPNRFAKVVTKVVPENVD